LVLCGSDCIEISAPSVPDPISAGALLAADVASAAIDDSSGGSAANDEKLGIDAGIDGDDDPSVLRRLPLDGGWNQQKLLTGENDTNRSSRDDKAGVVLQASGQPWARGRRCVISRKIKVMPVRGWSAAIAGRTARRVIAADPYWSDRAACLRLAVHGC
jgi:hypothetical protein